MDLKFLWNRIRYLLLDPDKGWHTISAEKRPLEFVRNNFFLPLVILVSISAFLGSLLFMHTGVSEMYSILAGIKYFLLFSITIYGTAFSLQKITVMMEIKSDFTSCFKIVLYSSAPLLLCQIISRLFESFIFINILSLYGLYIFWVGIEIMLNPPENKRSSLLLASASVYIALFVLTGWLLTTVIDKIYFAFFA